jgi:hypothetical protein
VGVKGSNWASGTTEWTARICKLLRMNDILVEKSIWSTNAQVVKVQIHLEPV